MSHLDLSFFGAFQVSLDGEPISHFRSANIQGLLAYLALNADRAFPRDALITLFWPDEPEKTARANFRQSLYLLRKLLKDDKKKGPNDEPPIFLISRQTIQFNPDCNYSLDVSRFAQAMDKSDWTRAMTYVAGELLPAFPCDSMAFEEWLQLEREHWQQRVQEAVAALTEQHFSQGNFAAAQSTALRLLEIDPWSEPAYRTLMQALAAQGDTQGALSHYATYCQILLEEFGAEPSPSTQALAQRLRDGEEATSVPSHNLVAQQKSLIGRADECDRLHELITTERMVTLLGIGGVGKSHLAQVVAHQALPHFRDGVWFIPLANIEANEATPERIAMAIAVAIGFPLVDAQNPLAELTSYLGDKELLLILDNWEHILKVAEALLYPLLTESSVHILATSRIRLMIEGELSMPLAGLPQKSAFELFVARARRLVPDFANSEEAEIAPHIHSVCKQVAGLPLGIELAASWVEHFTVAEISQSMAKLEMEAREMEASQAGTLAERHQNLHSVFEYSWRLLSANQQQILANVSIFHGGFDRSAAEAVAQSGLSDLSILMSHSLVQRVLAGRYDLHPLIHEFATHKLDNKAAVVLHHHHARHYLGKLATIKRAQFAEQLQQDFENVRSGWQRAIWANNADLLQESSAAFGEFMQSFGLVSDGDRLLEEAVSRFEVDPQHNELVAQLLTAQRFFRIGLAGDSADASLSQRILTLTRDPSLLVNAHIQLATVYSEEGNWAEVDAHFEQIEALIETSSDLNLYISAVESRIHIKAIHFRGDFAQGIARLEEMLTLLDTNTTPLDDEELLRMQLLESQGMVAARYGDYGLAIRCAQQRLAQATEISHQMEAMVSLLDLALAEHFAGLSPKSVSHNQEALALAEELGDFGAAALAKANLCMSMRQSDDLKQALRYGEEAIEVNIALGNSRIVGQARNRAGHILLMLARWEEAYAMYAAALVVWEPLQHPNRYEAVAGQAAAAMQLGKQKEALGLVQEVLGFVEKSGLIGIVEPVRLLLNCEAVFSAAGKIDAARQVLKQAEEWIEMIAARISDEEVRTTFLQHKLDNQLLKERLASFA